MKKTIYDNTLSGFLTRTSTLFELLAENVTDDTDQAKREMRQKIDKMIVTYVPQVKDNSVNIITVDTIARLRMESMRVVHEISDTVIDIRAYRNKPSRIKLISILTSMGFIFETLKGFYGAHWYVSDTDLSRSLDIINLMDTITTDALDLKEILITARDRLKDLDKDEPMDSNIIDEIYDSCEKLFSTLSTLNIYMTMELHAYIEDDHVGKYPKKIEYILSGTVIGGLFGMCVMIIVHFLLHM